MKADWDDAPRRVKKGREDNSAVRLIGIIAVLAGGLFLVLLTKDWEPGKTIHFDWNGSSNEEPDTAIKRDMPPVMVEPEPLLTRRQTSFNAANYTPSNRINILQSVPVNQPQRSVSTRQYGLTGSMPAAVHWQDARGRRTTWQTSFTFQNGKIDNRTFCLNVGKGSIEYLECRKGAREWLKSQCLSSGNMSVEWRRMVCHAHSSYRT
ncbi:hypothetical protein [Halopseudomonas pelagia]|uniref:hypothetical protein n=1 Tax=Halopseudomonas pelagia TaxID=553151 RepID=UPI0003AA1040|nr:hypothetical protein [Halopseudomonas pelagia]|tara:strand:- start:606 stop:1226 length:621 start_codon:yes stop_codon:yes gene_type:complete